MTTGLPRMLRPCGGPQPCPWRLDAPPGQFPAERYACLASTSRRPDGHGEADAPLGSPMFACHTSPDGRERACAGWLAVEGWGHLGVRFAVLTGALPQCALAPGPDWPPLHASYAELAEINGVPQVLTQPAPRATIGGMSETTSTRERTATYIGVEMALKQRHPEQPDLTLEGWVIAQRNLGVAWRPMAAKLHTAARLDLLPKSLQIGYEALRRWFDYLDEDEGGPAEVVAARTAE